MRQILVALSCPPCIWHRLHWIDCISTRRSPLSLPLHVSALATIESCYLSRTDMLLGVPGVPCHVIATA